MDIKTIIKEIKSNKKEMEKLYKEHEGLDYNDGDEQWEAGYIRACEEILNFIQK